MQNVFMSPVRRPLSRAWKFNISLEIIYNKVTGNKKLKSISLCVSQKLSLTKKIWGPKSLTVMC